eukprot:168745-Pyramimonas_sp.AAC.1
MDGRAGDEDDDGMGEEDDDGQDDGSVLRDDSQRAGRFVVRSREPSMSPPAGGRPRGSGSGRFSTTKPAAPMKKTPSDPNLQKDQSLRLDVRREAWAGAVPARDAAHQGRRGQAPADQEVHGPHPEGKGHREDRSA